MGTYFAPEGLPPAGSTVLLLRGEDDPGRAEAKEASKSTFSQKASDDRSAIAIICVRVGSSDVAARV